jgi:AraC-like DNA-binding protein
VYDAARWLRPPPPSRSLHASNGLGVLTQVGHSADPGGPQESLVRPGRDYTIVIVSHAAAYEAHIGGRPLRLDASLSVVTSPPSVAQRWISQPNHNRVTHLHISPARLGALVPDRDLSCDFHFRALTEPTQAHLARAFLARSAKDRLTALEADSYAVLLSPLLLRQIPSAPRVPGGLAPWQLRNVLARMRADLDRDIGLADIAAEARLSPFHFARAFKASIGVPPHRYLVQLRLERARGLLETTDLPVTDIAARIGYDDPGYLARLFRKSFGTTPADYRRVRR